MKDFENMVDRALSYKPTKEKKSVPAAKDKPSENKKNKKSK